MIYDRVHDCLWDAAVAGEWRGWTRADMAKCVGCKKSPTLILTMERMVEEGVLCKKLDFVEGRQTLVYWLSKEALAAGKEGQKS